MHTPSRRSFAKIETECWEGGRSRRETFEGVTSAILREQFSRLDGDRIDALWIELEGVGELCVGGGPDRFIVVAFASDGSSSHVEVESDRVDAVELQVGGQTGRYASTMVLPAGLALEMAERFLESGHNDCSRHWVEDCPPE